MITVTTYTKGISKKAIVIAAHVVVMVLLSILVAPYINFSGSAPFVAIVDIPVIRKFISTALMVAIFFNTVLHYKTMPLAITLTGGAVFMLLAILLAPTNPNY